MREHIVVKNDFNEAVNIIDKSFGNGYSTKNPELVRFLMEKIQQEKDRALSKSINDIK